MSGTESMSASTQQGLEHMRVPSSRRRMGLSRMSLLAPLILLPLSLALFPALASSGRVPQQPPFLKEPSPTQFEVAMMQTMKAVREGRAPDPQARKTDGTPGTLLDALLPESLTEEAKAHHRRKLGSEAKWRFFGANIPFLSGPSLSALNASFFRYASVSPLGSVDWRKTMYITPVQAQYDCASCWVMATADSVAMATGIATGMPSVPAGVQQMCDCGGLRCCQGGWPEDAFAWMVGNGNITTAANYNYWSMDGRTCSLQSNYPVAGKITGWERVPIFSKDDLMKAVSMQPVLVYISASSKDFLQYSSSAPGTGGFKIYDGNCNNEVNHAVLVVGYNTTGSIDYWIIKNTWIPFGWGDNGFMYLRMLDGPGKCGIQTVNPIYPVYFPTAPTEATVDGNSSYPVSSTTTYWWQSWTATTNPCTGIINPCGAGMCYQQNGLARCSCPSPYVELIGVPTSKCVNANPCTIPIISPCGAGTCMNVGDGSYICGCPTGYTVGTRVNGAPTCIPVSALGVKSNSYAAQYRDTCATVIAAYNMSQTQFTQLNPYVKCGNGKRLVPGLVVNLPATNSPLCTQQYTVRPGDTCAEISYFLDYQKDNFLKYLDPATWTSSTDPARQPSLLYTVPALNYNGPSTSINTVMSLNPSLNCSNLVQGQQICVQGTTSGLSAAPITCKQTYTTKEGDDCNFVAWSYGLTLTYFKSLNPGINCNFNYGSFYAGVQLCISTTTPMNVTCSQWYSVQQGDTCAQIWNAANVSQFQLLYINPGLQCQPPYFYIGLQICIDSPLLSNPALADPSWFNYTVKQLDSWSTVQSQFASKCNADSIVVERIANVSGIANWANYTLVPGTNLTIPCVPKIGATCGCAPSLPVCGSDLVNYDSYCDARCNFATPLATNGPCSTCQNACAGRYGLLPSPTTACSAGTVCSYPQWQPPLSDASAVFTSTPLCNYRAQTCTKVCALKESVTGATSSACYNDCMACHTIPCPGTSTSVSSGGYPCPSCTSPGCTANGRSCATVCSYWNGTWNQTLYNQ